MKEGFLHKLLVVGVSLLTIWSQSPVAQALTVTPTEAGYWIDPAALLISAYKRSGTSPLTDVAYVEVFNNSDSLVDVRSWSLLVTTQYSGLVAGKKVSETKQSVYTISQNRQGLLEPASHATISMSEQVTGSSFVAALQTSMTPTSGFVPDGIVGLALVPVDTTMHDSTLTLKTTDASSLLLWRRLPQASPGYYVGFETTTNEYVLDDGLYNTPEKPSLVVEEIYPYASDCSPTDTSILCSDFVKLHNTSDAPISLDDYVLRTNSNGSGRYTSNTFHLAGTVDAQAYVTVRTNDDGNAVDLTSSGGFVWLEDRWGGVQYTDSMTSYPSFGTTKKGYSWAQKTDGTWSFSSQPQPGSANVFPVVSDIQPVATELAACPTGKYRNPDTNRCKAVEEDLAVLGSSIVKANAALAPCPEGQFRNPDTNRCKSSAVTAAAATLTPCKEGQERNPDTNRCRSISEAVASLIPCDEGYERNPATNRCRKATSLDAALAASAKNPASAVQAASSNVPLWGWGVGAVVGVGVIGYAVYEWREEIMNVVRRIRLPRRG